MGRDDGRDSVLNGFRFGPRLLGDGRVEFRLWAPSARSVGLRLRSGALRPMARVGEGWFSVEIEAGAGEAYRFRIDEDQEVPDPASRRLEGGVKGWSVVEPPPPRPSPFPAPPLAHAVFYEAHAGLLGGFDGLARELPRLKALGFTALEIMPIAEFPGSRGWGYDGVYPFAPHAAYGPPEALSRLVEEAHALGLMVFLDVVYNHFGPDGNFLSLYAEEFFRSDRKTAWGDAIDFRRPEVRRFFIENALYWLHGFGFDGLRLDAVHAIRDRSFLTEFVREVRRSAGGRRLHLVLENDDNEADLLRNGYDAQWNDDLHHVLHHLLTGEASGYYADYAEDPAAALARALAEGFVFQGDASPYRDGQRRGSRSADLPPWAFVSFLQNHDQIGNRAFGERLTSLCPPERLEAAVALLLLSPAPPLVFMGEETGSKSPFLYFTNHEPELAEAVREGRRREFAGFAEFKDERRRAEIPDPNAPETFEASRPAPGAAGREALFRSLLATRRERLFPHLEGPVVSDARPIGDRAVHAAWTFRTGARLEISVNFGDAPADAPPTPGGARLHLLRDGGEGPLGPCGLRAGLSPGG